MATWFHKVLAPFQPPIDTARHYSWHKLRKDLLAGLTVSVVEVPQAMAYALIAGVPPQYGLYTSIIQGVIGALLSSSEHLTTGPTNTQSLLIAAAVTRLNPADPSIYLQLVFGLTMLKGLIQLAFAAARMGSMVRYVSRSVIVGVAAGAGILIVVGQLPNFLGIQGTPVIRHFASMGDFQLPGVLGSLDAIRPHLTQVNILSIVIGVGAIAIMLGVRWISRLLPGALMAVIVSATLVGLAGWDEGQLGLIGRLPKSFPSFQVPRIGLIETEQLFSGALALALLGMLESVSIVKTIAVHTGERINPNQEFFAQGLKNFISSFLQCIPGSGSFTRSALDYAAGAATRFAAVFNAVFVAAIFWLFAAQARFIPLASLAAVLFVIAYGLIDFRYIARLARSSRSDFVVCIITLLATLLAPLQYAIFIGVFLNIGLYLRQASRLHMAEMVQMPEGRFFERPLQLRSGGQNIMFLQVEGDLFFGVADELQDRLTQLFRSGVRVVIFRLKRMHSIDATVLHVLDEFAGEMKDQGRYVILCGIRPDLMRVMKNYGLVDIVGRDNVFETGFSVFTSAKQALARARELVGSSIDAEGIDLDDDAEEMTYQI